MKRNRIGRWSVVGALAVAAAFAGWMIPTTAPAAANPPGQLAAFDLMQEDGINAVLNVVSTPATAGSTCHVLVDGVPSAIITLMSGSNPVMVPQGLAQYTATGGGFEEESVNSGYGKFDDPGALD